MEAVKKYQIDKLVKIASIIISYEKNKHKIENIINIIKSEGIEIIDISTEEGNLEDVFIQLTKN